jgi:phage terminase small subunit
MTAGRPRKPIEQKRKTGRTPNTDSGGRKLPDVANVTVLPMAQGTPLPPMDLGLEGRELWQKAWDHAITWLSPISDVSQVHNACRIADDLALARNIYTTTRDSQDGRLVVALNKSFQDALSSLGFTPTSRSQLGVAEVKRVTALEQLIANKRAK